jgi:hypothetical protein
VYGNGALIFLFFLLNRGVEVSLVKRELHQCLLVLGNCSGPVGGIELN